MSKPLTPEIYEKERIDYYLDGLVDLGDILSSENKLQKISSSILHLILGTLMFSKGGILLYNKRDKKLHVLAQRGIDIKNTDSEDIDDKLIENLLNKNIHTVKENDPDSNPFNLNKDFSSKLNSKIIVPLTYKNEFLGIVSLCKKFTFINTNSFRVFCFDEIIQSLILIWLGFWIP